MPPDRKNSTPVHTPRAPETSWTMLAVARSQRGRDRRLKSCVDIVRVLSYALERVVKS